MRGQTLRFARVRTAARFAAMTPSSPSRGASLRHLHQQKETGIDLSLFAGGDDQTRTDYLYVANVSLYRVSYIPVQMLYYYTVFAPIFQSFLLAFRIIFQKNFLRARVRALYRGGGAQEKQNAGRFAAAGRERAGKQTAGREQPEHEAESRTVHSGARRETGCTARAGGRNTRRGALKNGGAVHGDGARRKGRSDPVSPDRRGRTGSQQVFLCGGSDRRVCIWRRLRTDKKSCRTAGCIQGDPEAEKTGIKQGVICI